MLSIRDIHNIFITQSPVALSTGGFDSLNVGELGVFTPSGVRVVGANVAAQDRVVLALKTPDNEVRVSDVIEKDNFKYAKAAAGVSEQFSIDYVGFNGATGDIDEIDDNDYFLTFYIEELFEASRDGRYNKHVRAHTDDNADKHEVAKQLVEDAIRNLGVKSKESESYLKAELTSGGAKTALGTAVGPLEFTKGSPYVKVADADDTTGGGSALVAGAYLATDDSATAGLMEIIAVDTTNDIITLANPWQDASTSIADTVLRQVSAVAFDGAAVGVKFTSLPLSFDSNRLGRSRFVKALYTITGQNMGNTLFTSAQSSNKGVNTSKEVGEFEYASWGALMGDNGYQIGEPVLFRQKILTDFSEDTYDSITITFKDVRDDSFRNDNSHKELTFFYPSSEVPAWLSTATNGVRAVLESYLGLSGGTLTP